jgi:hypothetical protein
MASALLVLTCLVWRDAFGCACCTDAGQRHVGIEKLDSFKLGEIQKVRFARQARLFLSDAGFEGIKGIVSPSEWYELQVSQENGGFAFSLRDQAGGRGVLSLSKVESVSVFEVDPRDTALRDGSGPRLYKEWKLTSKLRGTGIFAPGMTGGAFITLILQGHGNSCTSSEDFTHWTVVVQGPHAAYSFFGDLLADSPH